MCIRCEPKKDGPGNANFLGPPPRLKLPSQTWAYVAALTSHAELRSPRPSRRAARGEVGLIRLAEPGARAQGGHPQQTERDPDHLAQPPDERVGEPERAPEAQGAEDGDVATLERAQGGRDHEARELDGAAEGLQDQRRDDRGVGPEEEQDEVDLEAAGGPRRSVQERGGKQGASMLPVEPDEPAVHGVEPSPVSHPLMLAMGSLLAVEIIAVSGTGRIVALRKNPA